MAVGEAKKQVKKWNIISQVSWTDGTAMDVYYWLDHSFQYSRNINCDDELHWIKLSTKAYFTQHYAWCQLTSVGDNWVVALNVTWLAKPIWFDQYTFFSGGSAKWDEDWYYNPNKKYHVCPWVVFQDYFWFPVTDSQWNNMLSAIRCNWNTSDQYTLLPYDHWESTDESISDPSQIWDAMWANHWVITAILNYNNSRLVVACGQEIWVYYPELDLNSPVTWWTPSIQHNWETWWKKVLTYEAWVTIVALTCSFEYLKVRCVDEWWNTKVYYYQGNNNLRNTFVYNLVDLTWVRVLRAYNINWIDYYVSSIDWTDGFINLYKLVWTTPVQLFKTRAWLDEFDVNFKAPYFVWPVGINAAYSTWKFYIADSYGLFQFTYNPQSFDKGYMKRALPKYRNWTFHNEIKQVYWVCENQWYLYVSTEDGCYIMRVIDTWKPVPESKSWTTITYKTEWYQEDWILISREYEWREWGTVTKMLDEARLNFELNPNVNESQYASDTQPYWTIDVYVSPNNLWKDTNPSSDGSDKWFKVMSITKDSKWTRTEKSNLFNDLQQWESAFKFDWQTITYAIVIKRWSEPKVTPIVRQIDLKYHCKDKVNNVYDIN